MKETKDIIKTVKKIEIKTRRLVDGMIAGNYHSIFKGNGIEFSEIREYQPGDDIRSIDWKVTSRYNRPFVKEFIEERDLTAYIVIDFSSSKSFGNLVSKKRKSLEIAATLIFSAIRNNDKAGLFIFTDKIEKFIPARKGKKHAMKLLSTLVSFEPLSRTTNIKNSLDYVSKIIKKRSIIFLVSDFMTDEDFLRPLQHLRKHNDVIAIRVHDKREKEIPEIGLIELEDEETGEQILIDTEDPAFQENYKRLVHDHEKRLIDRLRKNRIDMIDIDTDSDYANPLKRYFKEKIRRIYH